MQVSPISRMYFYNALSLLLLRSALLISFFLLISGSAVQATTTGNPPPTTNVESALPVHLGTVVYQTHPAAPSRIYIIANGHRSAFSGANAAATVQAQMETFRIGEWLIKQQRIELLLPEGFFGVMGPDRGIEANRNPPGDQALREALKDTSHFVNAELLLHDSYGIGLEQVENRKLYRNVREQLRTSLKPGSKFSSALSGEIAQLQKLRTAYLLQAAPGVVAKAYQQGRITAPNAMLTIGLSHLEDIISFLQSGESALAVLEAAGLDSLLQTTPREPAKQNVGITVVVPPSLMATRMAFQQRSRFDEAKVFTR